MFVFERAPGLTRRGRHRREWMRDLEVRTTAQCTLEVRSCELARARRKMENPRLIGVGPWDQTMEPSMGQGHGSSGWDLLPCLALGLTAQPYCFPPTNQRQKQHSLQAVISQSRTFGRMLWTIARPMWPSDSQEDLIVSIKFTVCCAVGDARMRTARSGAR